MRASKVLPHEIFWREHFCFLERRGYRLRPRYDPLHVPSREHRRWCDVSDPYPEDEIAMLRPSVLDAIRMSDNSPVVLRRAATWSDEVPILRRLERLRSDPRNRIAPLLDIFPLPDSDDELLIVMPLLRVYYDPPFSCPRQVLHALVQLLEMMQFLHDHNIAHRDFCTFNIMLDPTDLFPEGFHFVMPRSTADGQAVGLNYRDRAAVPSIRYFLIDFGLSTQLTHEHALVTGVYGADKSVPELSWDKPYNPFKVDVYQFGHVIMHDMVELYDGLDFLRPLAESMTQSDPFQRPTATEALEQVQNILASLPSTELQKDIWPTTYSRLHFSMRPRPARRSCC
ncbi:kinase-like domain-containing protein [Schizophyllum commune]